MNHTASTTAERSMNGRIAAAPSRIAGRRAGRAAIAVAVLLVIASAVAVAGLVAFAGGGASYLAVARPVAFGAPIAGADLTTVRMSPGSVLRPIPESQRERVIGSVAARPLEPGDLLTRAAISTEPVAGAGKKVVSVPLKAELAPARRLAPMTKVHLVELPDGTSTSQPGTRPVLPTADGVVLSVKDLEYSAGIVVDVIVNQAAAVNLAAAAAAGKVAVVVNGTGS
jgi:hypothetical protein